MNKNLKRLIALVLAMGTFSMATPATNLNLLMTKAYAADNSTEELSSLKLEKTSGSDIQLYSEDNYDSDSKVDDDEVNEGDTYYAKTSSTKVKIEADGPEDDYVRIFKGTSSSTKGKELGDSISLSSGTTKLIVRIYGSEPEDDVTYGDDDDVVGTYTIKVKCTSDSSDEEEDDDSETYDDIYLDKLSVEGKNISLSDSKTIYTYSVANDASEVAIKAVPPDEDDETYSVSIDGEDVDSDNSFKHTVDLSTGENQFKIKLKNEDDEERDYTLKITRGNAGINSDTTAVNVVDSKPNTATNISNSQGNNGTNVVSTQQGAPTQVQNQTAAVTTKTGWISVNGGWQFYDSTGNQLKNSWYFDKNYGEWYYLGENGMMSANCWILTAGKYYYLGSDGAMVTNTTIGKYKVGADGAWIK